MSSPAGPRTAACSEPSVDARPLRPWGSRLAQAGRQASERCRISQVRSTSAGPWPAWFTRNHVGQLSKARSNRTTTPSEVTRANSHPPDSSAASSMCSARSTLVRVRTAAAGRWVLVGDGVIRPCTTITAYSKGKPGPLARDHCTRVGGRCISIRSTSTQSRICWWIWLRSRVCTPPGYVVPASTMVRSISSDAASRSSPSVQLDNVSGSTAPSRAASTARGSTVSSGRMRWIAPSSVSAEVASHSPWACQATKDGRRSMVASVTAQSGADRRGSGTEAGARLDRPHSVAREPRVRCMHSQDPSSESSRSVRVRTSKRQ